MIFLKLGGSLITDKDRPHTPRREVIARLADEIAQALPAMGDARLLLGHGSGSFGHAEASKRGTRAGVRSPSEWHGFAEVWSAAAALNRLVMDGLRAEGLPAIAFPPSANCVARDGAIVRCETEPIRRALEAGLIPVVYGDVAVDEVRGGTIVSTEDVFVHLAERWRPDRLVLAGVEAGVYSDYPAGRSVIAEITPGNFESFRAGLQGSAWVDVTGGMLAKVTQMLRLVERLPGLTVQVVSGEAPGLVGECLRGGARSVGTRIRAG